MRTRALLTFLTITVLWPVAAAQGSPDLKIGVILSRSGHTAAAGTVQWSLATRWESRLAARGGIFGAPVQIELVDDLGDPRQAVTLAERLVDEGALAIVCCSTPEASVAVAGVAERLGVTLLAPSPLPAVNGEHGSYWAFSLTADATDVVAAVVAQAYREGRTRLGLLRPATAAGELVASDLVAHLAVIGGTVSRDVPYDPGATVLTPEALLLATSQADALLVWGTATDLIVALDALERRGYDGLVYADPQALRDLPPASAQPLLRGVRFTVVPAAVASQQLGSTLLPQGTARPADDGGSGGACASAGELARDWLEPGTELHTAPFLAALELLDAGLQQLVALRLGVTDPRVTRGALRDALVGLPATCTGAGLIDMVDGSSNAVLPRGLATAALQAGGLIAVP